MAYWWVNQKQTWRHEITGEYLWSPKRTRTGARLEYDALAPGDTVFPISRGSCVT